MATMTPERPQVQEHETTTLVERRRTGVVVLAIAIAALLGFGLGWAAFRDTGTDVPDDVQELIDTYTDAWNDADGEAAAALMSSDARFWGDSYTSDPLTRDEVVDWVDGVRPDSIETLSSTVMNDDPYVVVLENTVGGIHGYSMVTIDELGGQLLILDHVWLRG